MIKAKINSQLVSCCASEARWSHKSSNLILAWHSRSSWEAPLDLKILGRLKCLCISICKLLPSRRILHHITIQDFMGSKNFTYNPWVSFNCCLILILLSSCFAIVWRGLSALAEYLTTSCRWNWSLSSPMNSVRRWNEFTDQWSRWNNGTLTKDSNDSYHSSLFHCFK